jgi:proline iminopeptidase
MCWVGFVFAASALVPYAHAYAKFELSPNYTDGSQFCMGPNGELAQRGLNEYFKWIDVPIDYQRPTLGSSKIYAWSNRPIDPKAPFLLFINGGPGQSFHGITDIDKRLPGYNVIYFDQRGVACSRPTLSLARDSHFFSSKSTALDADSVRKAFGAEKWSVYGHSYGTVPATIIANMIPETITALVLEGVVFDGMPHLWGSEHQLQIMQKIFDRLPDVIRAKVLTLSERPDVSPFWFSSLVHSRMLEDRPFLAVSSNLESHLGPSTSSGLPPHDEEFAKMFGNLPKLEDEGRFGFSNLAYLQIVCQELSGLNPRSGYQAIFNPDRKLVAAPINTTREACGALGLTEQDVYLYDAVRYPTNVPVTYIQGTMDGATEFPGAVRHFKNVAQGPAQIIISVQGGHKSSQGPWDSDAFLKVFSLAVEGKRIPEALVDALASSRRDNRDGDMSYKIKYRNFNAMNSR